jgi:hypothetical protein
MTGNSYAVKVLKKTGSHGGMQLEAISREVSTWVQAQGSKFVAKLEGLYEVRGAAWRWHQEKVAAGMHACSL